MSPLPGSGRFPLLSVLLPPGLPAVATADRTADGRFAGRSAEVVWCVAKILVGTGRVWQAIFAARSEDGVAARLFAAGVDFVLVDATEAVLSQQAGLAPLVPFWK